MGRQVDVLVEEPYRSAVSTAWLRMVARTALDAGEADVCVEMGLVLTGDDALRKLNRDYRGLDEVTDVLAFSFVYPGRYESEDHVPFLTPPGTADNLGDVIVSCPQAERQARDQGHPVKTELAVLVSHGVLHLLGHDHLEEGEARTMKGLEALVFAKLF